ncbi:hypothetical protein C8Q72DRAFT_858953 [Fomitopsis betulina]|nr:hypothetical protein C8Q72DRAFT_858953 [Fomitopsis betulina]
MTISGLLSIIHGLSSAVWHDSRVAATDDGSGRARTRDHLCVHTRSEKREMTEGEWAKRGEVGLIMINEHGNVRCERGSILSVVQPASCGKTPSRTLICTQSVIGRGR